MSSKDSSREKNVKISLTGDIEKCDHCKTDDKKLREYEKVGYTYDYTNVNSDAGQQKLKDYGVKEGESVDIPIVKVETCEWNKNSPTDKKCKTSDWKDSYWSDIENGKLPEEVTKV